MFKVGDIVRIVSNTVNPEMEGKIGKISKVYPTFHHDGPTLYRVNVRGKLVKGVAMDSDLSLISSGEE